MKFKLIALLVIALIVSACSSARTPEPTANIQIEDVWLVASEIDKSDQSAPVYLTISNDGGTAVGELLGAQTPIVTSNDVVKSTQLRNGDQVVPRIDIPIDEEIKFSPSGYHILITSLPPTLKAGDTFPLTLAFADGDNRIVTVIVRP